MPLTFELLDKIVTIAFFSLHFISILFVMYLTFSWFSFKISYYDSRRNFFHGHWEAIYFFSWWRKVWKVTITNYCLLITDPFPSHIFIIFLFTWTFWINLVWKMKINLLHLQNILCVTDLSYYLFLWSYLTSLLLIYHHSKFHGKNNSF